MSRIYEYYLMWAMMLLLASYVAIVIFNCITSNKHNGLLRRVLATILGSGLVFFAFGLYLNLGYYKDLKDRYSFEEIDRTLMTLHQESQLTKEQVISSLKNTEKRLSASERTWARLADTYQALNLYEAAAHAYHEALQFHPHFEAYEIQLAYCQVMINDGKVDEKTLSMLKHVLEKAPEHKGALNLLALHAYQDSNYSSAIAYWQRILANPQNLDEAEAAAIHQAIAKAQRLIMGGETVHTAPAFKLEIELKLSQALKDKLTVGDTLFIIAKDPTGSPMPVAVRKYTVQNFPMQISLSDEHAMLKDRMLSSLKHVKIFARISKTGQPIAQKGDLEGYTDTLEMASIPSNVLVEIDHMIE
ncbi:hypothetical protein CC99x_011010 [Candidatus Berkiella cookevillensis]|uniref:Formate-dependent nitrite reductase complex subunit NrfG n=1 Tax=Candidatus Berkiella cookevillensis TaxID=437022 RepID=A0A0Q9YT17_9GAMM|nr:hypothetical protein [Candidatus Berkiella cookevillensis]MCS5709430.1 hypothetical protein [Candidatus Berkiella cookevillensis]